MQLVDPPDQLETIDLRHAQIADHYIRLFAPEDIEAFQAITGLQNGEAAVFQVGRETRTHHFVIIDNQQRGTGCVHWVSRQTAPGQG
ncbi:hypothetical protein D3C71_1956970 [compost metagenome]